MFSHLKRSPAELASSKTDTDRRLSVVIGSDPQFDDLVVNKARDLYAKLLRSGRCRTSARRLRIDHGRKGVKERPGSKQAWMRARKQAVDKAAQEEAEIRTPLRRPPVELPESLAKEAAKQDQLAKKGKRKLFSKARCWRVKSLLRYELKQRRGFRPTLRMTKTVGKNFWKSSN